MYIFYNELTSSREKLLNEISSLDDTAFNQRLEENEWTIAQICHHLALTDRIFRKGIEYGLQKPDVPSLKQRSIQTIRDRKYKIDAPDIVKPNSQAFETQELLEILSSNREKLITLLKSIQDEQILLVKSAVHPVFKEVSLKQWIEMIYLHELRHIDQIQDIKLRLFSSEQRP